MSAASSGAVELDPFDQPEWLGEVEVTWSADVGIRTGHHVLGRLTGPAQGQEIPCDLLAIDEAYPRPVADDATRLRAHQAWRHDQILLIALGDDPEARLTLSVPGTTFTADLVLDALSRLAKAVGATPDHYAARLRIGADNAGRGR
ncbi:hypothetical protein [Nocardioides sp.]|uniref:hypothetical protein n=1 Tax=Nocardioides sp. TaxID=35761 RepID=UPI00356AFDD7